MPTACHIRQYSFSRRFLITVVAAVVGLVSSGGAALSAAPKLEKTDLKFGFIKLTDCVPLIIAKEMNFFEDEGLYVSVEAQSNWKILLDRVISGELDGAHMLAGQPLAATIGYGYFYFIFIVIICIYR